jgi:hypothetical protein
MIPGNDDALRAIRLIAGTISQAYLDGRSVFEATQKELAEQMEKQRQLQAQQAAVARESAARAAAAARKEAEGKEPTEATAPTPEGAAQSEQGKPRTTMRKALQRKIKPRRHEPAAPGESHTETAPGPEAGGEQTHDESPGEPAQAAEPAEQNQPQNATVESDRAAEPQDTGADQEEHKVPGR